VALGATLLAQGKGGIACVARMMARALIEAGANLDMLSLLDEEPIEIAGVVARRAHGSRIRYGLMCHAAAWRNDYAVYDSVGMARAHPKFGSIARRYAVWVHGIEVWWDLHPARKRALERCELAFVNSHFTLEKFASIHGQLPQARVCLLGTEDDEPPRETPAFDGPPTVLTLGRIDRDHLYKGHHELIAAWPKVLEAVPRARLVLAGGGNGLEIIRQAARVSPVARAIEVPGFVPVAALPPLWRRAHVFAMPSRGEGFGLVYIDAMRQGLPVIASVHDAGREVNLDGVTGYNVNLDEKGALAERLIALLRDPATAAQMGRQGQARWASDFRYSAFARRFLDAVADVLPLGGVERLTAP
jgi:phosphatidylinositol alpha-1,6-mannosyltransferase